MADWERQASEQGLKFRLIEWGSPEDLEYRIRIMNEKYRSADATGFMHSHLLRGHGHERHIAGGLHDSSEFHTRREPGEKWLKLIASGQAPGCIAIVESCYSGEELGAWLSKILGKVITPPNMTAAIQKVKFKKTRGVLEPQVTYEVSEREESKPRIHHGYFFNNGRRIKHVPSA